MTVSILVVDDESDVAELFHRQCPLVSRPCSTDGAVSGWCGGIASIF